MSRSPRPTLSSLTGIRFVAAFIVTLFHANATLRTFPPYEDFHILRFGYIGVSLFFVLSGFILTYTYIQSDDTLRGDRSAFWWARFSRVYPVYFLGLLLAAPLFLKRFTAPGSSAELHDIISTSFLAPLLLQSWWPPAACQWNCVGWSLSVETLFYAMFPVLGVWLARQSLRGALTRAGLMWITALALAFVYLAIAPDGIHIVDEAAKQFWISGLKYNPVIHLGEFAVGIGCGLLFMRRPISNATTLLTIGVVALMAVIVIMIPAVGVPYPFLHSGIVAPAFAAIIYALACSDASGNTSVLGHRIMFKLGESSYALYLIHATVLGYAAIVAKRLHITHGGIYGVVAIAIVSAVVLSIAIFEYVEEPARKWLRKRSEIRSVASSATQVS